MKIERDIDYKIKVMTAYKEGKKIRYKQNDSNSWSEGNPCLVFNWEDFDYEIIPENPEYTYPMWFSCNNIEGLIVKFEGLTQGTIGVKGKMWVKGGYIHNFLPHTDSTVWTQIEEPKQKVTIENWLVELNNNHIICETSNIDSWIKEFAELDGTEIKKVRLIESYDIEI